MKLVILFFSLCLIGCASPQEQIEEPVEKPIPIINSEISFTKIADGFNQPLGISHSNDASGRLFIVERGGTIRIIDASGTRIEHPFLDVSSLVDTDFGEQGLLGLVFHPKYKTSGRFFINYTNKDDDTIIAEYKTSQNTNVAIESPTRRLLFLEQPEHNHNGGHMAFSPKDNYLYIGTGDGGGFDDPNDNAENLDSLLGKMLRLDVNTNLPYAVPNTNPYVNDSAVRSEIWAHGLRNPWRFSFDRLTGDLYIGDVGQARYEEINFQPNDSNGKENYGWDTTEGLECNEPRNDCNKDGISLPILTYGRDQGVSVTGGYVYRGSEIPWLQGKYIYGDFATGIIWMAEQTASGWKSEMLADTEFNISSFGEDAAGELYLADYSTGSIYKFSGVVE